MSFNGFEEFNIEDFTGLDNNNFCGGSFGFDELNWNVSNAAGQSQPYMGADVRGELNNYPDFPSPTSAPTSLYPADGALPDEGKPSHILTAMVRKLTLLSQDATPRFTKAWLCLPSHHNQRPLLPLSTPASQPLHPSQPFRTAVSVFPSLLRLQPLICPISLVPLSRTARRAHHPSLPLIPTTPGHSEPG